jgi:RimJ/RimL family protein N-acetyltransferase
MAWIPPRLETERLYLEAPENSGRRAFVFNGKDAAEQNLPGLPSNWRIFLKRDDQPVGTVGFIRWEPEAKTGEIGFIIIRRHAGFGYMTEACKAVLAFGFGPMGLERIEAKSLPENRASIRVMEKIGMKKEGRFRGRLSSNGPLVDLDLFVAKRAVQ